MIIDIPFLLLHISVILLIIMFCYIYNIKSKKQIHYAFGGIVGALIIWSASTLCKIYVYNTFCIDSLFFNNLMYIGIITVPVFMFFGGKIFAYTEINFNWQHRLILLIPFISMIIIFTKSYLFISKGWYFIVHATYSYGLILAALYYLIYFSVKNSGFFSKQSLLIIIGALLPLMVNVLLTIQVLDLPYYSDSISFSFAIICFMFAIFKFDFLNVVPIAMQKVVDNISDNFVVIDENYNIVDYNSTFYNNFKGLIDIKRSKNLLDEIFKNSIIDIDKSELQGIISKSISEKNTIKLQKVIKQTNNEKVFDIDIAPIFNHDRHIGTIILFKDITELQNVHKQLLEQEKFSSLGQLIGGIAHDLNSRLYALDGQIYLINNYANEIKNNETLNRGDYIEIAKDIQKRIEEIKVSTSSMSKTIDSVRNHTRNHAIDNIELFSVSKVIETIQLLMNQKLKRHNCTLTYKQNEKDDIQINGDFSKFESVLINIVSNAIEAYDINGERKSGRVEIYAEEKENEIIISVTDYGKGIPENIRESLFKEIITTKGSKGTGMGLYFSKSIIVGNFKGDIGFESEEGKGTTFYIKVFKNI